MDIEQALNAIERDDCRGCEFLIESDNVFKCESEDAHDCEAHKVNAGLVIIAATGIRKDKQEWILSKQKKY